MTNMDAWLLVKLTYVIFFKLQWTKNKMQAPTCTINLNCELIQVMSKGKIVDTRETTCMTTVDQRPSLVHVMHESVRNILIPDLLRAGAGRVGRAMTGKPGGPRGSGCVCAGGPGPSGASSSSPAARRRSSSPWASAPCPRSTGAPGRSLVSPEAGREKRQMKTNLAGGGGVPAGWSAW